MANKILLLGSTGTVGRTLSSSLDVIPVTRKDCDLTDFNEVTNLLKKHSPDVVLNCAGYVNTEMYQHGNDCLYVNYSIFENFLKNKDMFGKFINFGSGAEFDRFESIDEAKEESIVEKCPLDQYGFVKNVISNKCLEEDNFYTLRLFGLFSKYDINRFFSNIKDPSFRFRNRKFDYFSSTDLITVVKYFCENNPKYGDVNLVYKEKYRLSDYAYTIYKYNKRKDRPNFTNIDFNYTGCSDRLYDLGLPLVGLGDELRYYNL